MRNELEPIIRAIKLLAAEQAELTESGPRFIVVHRFSQPGTLFCTPGEAIAEVVLSHRTKRIPLPLSLRQLLLFDYLARHQCLTQCAAHIATGLNCDPFTRRHGAHCGANARLNKKVSRTAIREQIMRLRAGLRLTFRKAGLSLDPCRVLISEETTTNEVRYRLKASVNWEHWKY